MPKYKISLHAFQRFKHRTQLSLKHVDDKSLKVLFHKFLSEGYSEPRLKLYPFILNSKKLTDIKVNGHMKFYIKNNTVVTFIYNTSPDWWKH